MAKAKKPTIKDKLRAAFGEMEKKPAGKGKKPEANGNAKASSCSKCGCSGSKCKCG